MTFSSHHPYMIVVYKDGVSNMHTQDFIKEIHKAFTENHRFGLVKKIGYSSNVVHDQKFAKHRH
jgi:hypothetical protein